MSSSMKPWFNRFQPVAWQGWATYAVILIVAVWDLSGIARVSPSPGETLINFFPHAAGLFLILAIIIRSRRTDHAE